MAKTVTIPDGFEAVHIPDNVRIECEPFCSGCQYGKFELKTDEYERYNPTMYSDELSTFHTLKCVHMPVCAMHNKKEKQSAGDN